MGIQGRVPISEYDMKVMRHELMNLEKGLGLLIKRRQKEEDHLKERIEEDGKYLQRRADAIDREERNFLRQQKHEEEELLEQAKRKEQQTQQSVSNIKGKPTVDSTDTSQYELARSQVGDVNNRMTADGRNVHTYQGTVINVTGAKKNVARPRLEPRVSRLPCEHSTTELPSYAIDRIHFPPA